MAAFVPNSVELSGQCFSCFIPGIEAKYPLNRRQLGPRASVDAWQGCSICFLLVCILAHVFLVPEVWMCCIQAERVSEVIKE